MVAHPSSTPHARTPTPTIRQSDNRQITRRHAAPPPRSVLRPSIKKADAHPSPCAIFVMRTLSRCRHSVNEKMPTHTIAPCWSDPGSFGSAPALSPIASLSYAHSTPSQSVGSGGWNEKAAIPLATSTAQATHASITPSFEYSSVIHAKFPQISMDFAAIPDTVYAPREDHTPEPGSHHGSTIHHAPDSDTSTPYTHTFARLGFPIETPRPILGFIKRWTAVPWMQHRAMSWQRTAGTHAPIDTPQA